MSFIHPAQNLTADKKLVYTAMSKHLFYYRMQISKFVLEQNAVPLNPFMIFDYFLLETVDRNQVREANNTLVKRADELWVFGEISNGVLAEIQIAQSLHKPIKYFKIAKPHAITEISVENIVLEAEVAEFKSLIQT